MFNRNKDSNEGFNASYDRQMERNWQLVDKVVTESFDEQRKARRWSIFFKLATVVYLFILLIVLVLSDGSGKRVFNTTKSGKHTALVRIEGEISAQSEASADAIVTGLRDAFEHEGTVAVVLRLNSPGGSPVQAGHVYDEILRLKAKYPKVKVYAVIEDLGASGAYYIAVAADEIWCDRSSLVGSIGVTASSFGFVDVLDKLGVERRIFTSGEHKQFLDPFLPLKETEKDFWSEVLLVTHKQFISRVRAGRGDRLKEDENTNLYSGLIWSGEQALAMGLVDGLGTSGYLAREVIKEEEIIDFTFEPSPFEQFTKKLGVAVGQGIAHYLHAKTDSVELRY